MRPSVVEGKENGGESQRREEGFDGIQSFTPQRDSSARARPSLLLFGRRAPFREVLLHRSTPPPPSFPGLGWAVVVVGEGYL